MQQNKVCNHILSKRNGDFRVLVEVLLNAKGCCIDVPKSAVLTSQKDSSKIYVVFTRILVNLFVR